MNFYTARVTVNESTSSALYARREKIICSTQAGYFDRRSASGRVNAIVTICRSPDSRRQC